MFYPTTKPDEVALSASIEVFTSLLDNGLRGQPLKMLLKRDRVTYKTKMGEVLTVELLPTGAWLAPVCDNFFYS